STPTLARPIEGERLFQDARRRLRQMKFGEFFFFCEKHIGNVASGAGLAADAFTEIVQDDIVKARPPEGFGSRSTVRGVDPVEDLNQLDDANHDAGFFQQFTGDALFKAFSQFEGPARDRPLAAERLASTANQQRAAAINDHAADAHYGLFGVLSGRS